VLRSLHVVLIEPEIPPNTGAIARLCAASASPLHLVGPLGFRLDEQSVRRAGVDYWLPMPVASPPALRIVTSSPARRSASPPHVGLPVI
jgi:tRNA(Leu) C34 or U34 (ribose-2'-O)-methylase TrmL